MMQKGIVSKEFVEYLNETVLDIGLATKSNLTKEEAKMLKLMELAGRVVLKEDKKLFEELAKY